MLVLAIGVLFGAVACGDDESPEATAPSIVSPNSTSTQATPLSIADQIPPTATPTPLFSPTPVSVSEQEELNSQIDEEYLARCRVYVRENERPITYAEFVELNPHDMTDLERVLWAEEIGLREHCRDYWSEPLSAVNADKRNESYRAKCYESLWQSHVSFIERDGWRREQLRFDQAARIANWLNIPGSDLVEMDQRPLDLVLSLWEQRPSPDYGDYVEFDPTSEWAGLIPTRVPDYGELSGLWPRNRFEVGPQIGRGYAEACVAYHPQLFTDRWIPLDTAITRQELEERLRQATPTPKPDEMSAWINQRDREVYVGE